MAYEQTSFEFEQRSVFCPVVSLEDPLKQGRVQICPGDMQNAPRNTWPWVKVGSTNSQQSSQQGSTMRNAHSMRVGDQALFNMPTASGQDYTLGSAGHFGSVSDFSGLSKGNVDAQNYAYSGSPYMTDNGKKTIDQTTYPADGTTSYANPGTIETISMYMHVRDRAQQKLKNSQFQEDAMRLHKKAKHIGQSMDKNKITKIIQQKDPQGQAESSQNIKVASMLDKARDSLNQIPSMNGFKDSVGGGIMNGIQSMIGGQAMGFLQQFISMATQAGQNMNNFNANANNANQPYLTDYVIDELGNIIQTGPTYSPPPSGVVFPQDPTEAMAETVGVLPTQDSA